MENHSGEHKDADTAFNSCSPNPNSQNFETSSLVDPSYIIYLIRQLLPNGAGMKHEAQQDRNDINSEKDSNSLERVHDKYYLDANGNTEITDTDSAVPSSCNHQDNVSKENSTGREINQRKTQVVDVFDAMQAVDNHLVSDERKNIDCKLEVAEALEDEREDIEPKVQEDPQEEAGCVLWDLAANPSHAEFMVENHVLDVLVAMLRISVPDRMREICLGIMGNLACHAVPERAMVTTNGLVQIVVQQLFLNDSPSLSEICRLLSAGLHSEEAISWAEALEPEQILQRIMWIAANTMNSHLLEKSTELLLAMVDSPKEASTSLIPPLVRLGLPELLTDLLTCEITAITEGTPAHGNVVLDTILQIGEALSLADGHSAELASNKKLFDIACKVIKLSGKDEVGPPGITAAVLVANLLAEQEKLIDEILNDPNFLQNLLELLPSVSDDPGARNALWSILGRLFDNIALSQEMQSIKKELVLVLVSQSDLIAEDLDDHREEDTGEDDKTPFTEQAEIATFNKGFKAKIATVNKMVDILDDWIKTEEESSVQELSRSVKSASKLLKSTLADKSYVDDRKSEKHS
ncbi:hypothetical protein SUGI_0181970 [Cryptomeria japonica]|uniref:uncharacterized protein LOC131043549 n=1 Tax=Cryptomeria japonica TaxID=3369 RepID=UPI0024089EC7|nr:uncharacterized protein LOC131043549 [Cryptomeria japonica]GLJ12011.1 hypothetical protein SUGI_0181970 [Cryptomeria japonica]